MALTEAVAAYADCYEYFERAAAAPNGIRIWCENENHAGILRMRLNYARVLQRRESMRMYETTDPQFGKSEFDGLKVRKVPPADGDDGYWVYIEPWAKTIAEVEEL